MKNFKGNNGGKPLNIEGAETKKKTSFKEKSKDEAHFIREEAKSGKGNYYDPLLKKDNHTVSLPISTSSLMTKKTSWRQWTVWIPL